MKYLDLHAIIFVGVTLIHDYWLFWGLPQIQFWETKRLYMDIFKDDKDDKNKAA